MAFDDITRDGRVNQLSGQDAGDWPNSFRTSRFVPAVEYLRAQRARTLLMREMDKLQQLSWMPWSPFSFGSHCSFLRNTVSSMSA